MRDPKRIPRVLKTLGEAWKKCPELRLGQLLVNLATISQISGPDIFYVEDENLEQVLNKFIKTYPEWPRPQK